jgi:hypothetical protein
LKSKSILFVALVLLGLAIAVPLRGAFAGFTAETAAPLRQNVTVQQAQPVVAPIVNVAPQTKPQDAPALQPTPDPCANDTADGAELQGGADTDQVDLQCGDQNAPDTPSVNGVKTTGVNETGETQDSNVESQVESNDGEVTGTVQNESGQEDTPPPNSTPGAPTK